MERDKQQEACKALWKQCFGDTEQYTQFYFQEKSKSNQIQTICVTEHSGQEGKSTERLIAMLHLNPYQIQVFQTQINANYIVGVATDAHYRKRGYMRKLLLEALQHMYEQEQPFTYLMPASSSIYEPFGFRFIYEQQRRTFVEFQRKKLKLDQKEESAVRCVPFVKLSHRQLTQMLDFVGEQLNKSFTIFCKRTQAYYQMLSKEMQAAGGDVFIFIKQDKVIGVVSFMLEEKKLELVESIVASAEEEEITVKLLQEIVGENKDLESITFLEGHFLHAKIQEKLYPQIKEEKKTIIMGRIVHFQTFVETFMNKENLLQCGKKIVIAIKDTVLKQNNQTFLLEWKRAGWTASVSKEVPERAYTIEEFMRIIWKEHKAYLNEIT